MPLPTSVAKFRKLGGKAGLTQKFYTSSKNWNSILTTDLSLSNHWPSNKAVSLRYLHTKKQPKSRTWFSILSKCSQDLLIKNKSWTQKASSPELVFNVDTHHLLWKCRRFNVSYILHPWDIFFPTSYPITENEFSHTAAYLTHLPDPGCPGPSYSIWATTIRPCRSWLLRCFTSRRSKISRSELTVSIGLTEIIMVG